MWWGRAATMSEDANRHNLKVKIETEEYIYWEYVEA
jgi:hypothetical protein